MQNRTEEQELAFDILKLSRTTLLMNARFMESAFVKIEPCGDIDIRDFVTDGDRLYYNSAHVCRLYQKANELPTRDYMHVVLHCLFRHLFLGKEVNTKLWNLACDIAVENVINNMNIRSMYCERQESQMWFIRELKESIPKLTAEWIYKYLTELDMPEAELERLATCFYADSHEGWYRFAPSDTKDNNQSEDADEEENEDGDASADSQGAEVLQQQEDSGENTESTQENIESFVGGDDAGIGTSGLKNDVQNKQKGLAPSQKEQEWEEIARRVQLEMEATDHGIGEGYGDLQQNIQAIRKEKYDYTELLKRFSVYGENIEVNDDEFDYVYYMYGLNLYGSTPLVEPLEYKDVKKVREFVIAIDTSESVSGETVQKFVTKTWNILKQTENFFTEINVHILQCGARVEEDKKIRNQEEFDHYIEHMVLKGFGGTNFRPVFEHVDLLIRQHEFSNLKGLIYFTDGFGTFPTNPPPYDALFVFVDQGYDLPDIPVWALKTILKEEDIAQF